MTFLSHRENAIVLVIYILGTRVSCAWIAWPRKQTKGSGWDKIANLWFSIQISDRKKKRGDRGGSFSQAWKTAMTKCDLKRSQANWNAVIGKNNTYTWLALYTFHWVIYSKTNITTTPFHRVVIIAFASHMSPSGRTARIGQGQYGACLQGSGCFLIRNLLRSFQDSLATTSILRQSSLMCQASDCSLTAEHMVT